MIESGDIFDMYSSGRTKRTKPKKKEKEKSQAKNTFYRSGEFIIIYNAKAYCVSMI